MANTIIEPKKPIKITELPDNEQSNERIAKLELYHTRQEIIDMINLVYDNVYKLSNFVVPTTWPVVNYSMPNRTDEIKDRICELECLYHIMGDITIYHYNIVSLSNYSLITSLWLDTMASYLKGKKCLEVMCGNGMIGSELKKRKIDITLTTDKQIDQSYLIDKYWSNDVVDMDAIKAIQTYGKDMDYIIMSWPPEHNAVPYDCLVKMRQTNKNCKIIYIGEFKKGYPEDRFYDMAFCTMAPELCKGLFQWNFKFSGSVRILQ